MNKKRLFDFEIILPILFGGLSVAGIGIVFLLGSLYNPFESTLRLETNTPYEFIYLGTEPGISTVTAEATSTSTPIATNDFPRPVTDEPQQTDVVLPTRQPTLAATVTPTIPSVLSKVDDTYFQLLYDGDWVSQSNVTDTYQNTLHISFTVGNFVTFTFVGQQVIVSYQSGPSLGRISISLDGKVTEVDQSGPTTQLANWQSAILSRGTHTIVIAHLSGGSVNLDSITIPDVATPTPTSTITLTPTP
ncbi:MAG TPA: hypothetical protein DCX53_03295 [Anaerolineae bacterium]|nr:hypothetical protein [Anaerolineae bacterium]